MLENSSEIFYSPLILIFFARTNDAHFLSGMVSQFIEEMPGSRLHFVLKKVAILARK